MLEFIQTTGFYMLFSDFLGNGWKSLLMILEAMKMENEIMAPCDGTVSQICTSKGSSVGTGAALCVIG